MPPQFRQAARSVIKRALIADTYSCVSPAATVHDQTVGFVRANFERYTSGLGGLPGWQNLKQMRQMVLTTSLLSGFKEKKKEERKKEGKKERKKKKKIKKEGRCRKERNGGSRAVLQEEWMSRPRRAQHPKSLSCSLTNFHHSS